MLGELEGVHLGRHDRGANHSRHRPGSNLATNGFHGSDHRASFVCQHKQVNTGGHQTSLPQVRSGMVDNALGQVTQGQGNHTCRNAEDRSGNGTLGLILAGCDSSIEFAGANRPESKERNWSHQAVHLGLVGGFNISHRLGSRKSIPNPNRQGEQSSRIVYANLLNLNRP